MKTKNNNLSGEVMRKKMIVFIKEYMMAHNYPPTTREIMKGVGLKSTSSIHNHLQTLRDEGKIDFVDTETRTLTVKGIVYTEKEEQNNVTGV